MENKRFRPEHMERLDSPERRKALPPEALLGALAIGSRDDLLDIGAGTGYFCIPAARMTQGRVYALDVAPQMLAELETRVQQAELGNVTFVQGVAEQIPLDDHVVDHVIASFVLHETDPLATALAEIHRVLRPGGQCLCVEWEKTPSESGPPLHHRLHSTDLADSLERAGFTISSVQHPTTQHYVIVAQA